MQNFYLGFKFAFSYFCIIPVKFSNSDDLTQKSVLASMLLFFPLVGTVLGVFTIGIFYILESLSWYGAVISALSYMMLYGFLHTEAVMDVADAIYASHSGKNAYSIIKDPTVGAMGVLWSFAFSILKISGIVFLLMHHLFFEFISVLIVSRLTLLMLFYTQTFKSNFATQLKNAFSKKYLWSAFIAYGVIGFLLISVKFITLLALGVVFAYFITLYIKSEIGFVNGDVLGTTLESVEILLFTMVALFWL
jgi:adenosylcobinamide-GDP ribazoletransferase